MCYVFKVSHSGYYAWLKRKPSLLAIRKELISKEIEGIYRKSKGRYGSPKITKELISKGLYASRPRVARIMKMKGLRSIITGKFKVCTTDSNHQLEVSANILNREFTAERPSEKWGSDLTYIRTQGGNRSVFRNMIFHCDRGVQYACHEFRKLLKGMSVQQSMSRKGNCWDNAVSENFFKILKSETGYNTVYPSIEVAKRELFEFIEIWYKRQRRHSMLGYLTPEEFGKSILNQAA